MPETLLNARLREFTTTESKKRNKEFNETFDYAVKNKKKLERIRTIKTRVFLIGGLCEEIIFEHTAPDNLKQIAKDWIDKINGVLKEIKEDFLNLSNKAIKKREKEIEVLFPKETIKVLLHYCKKVPWWI